MVSNEQANIQIWGCSVDSVHILYIFHRGGNKMVIVNIILVTGMAMFLAEISQLLISMLIREFNKMED